MHSFITAESLPFNSFMTDQEIIFPYYINTISSRQVMRIEKNINEGIVTWSNSKFSKLQIATS